MFTEQHLLQVKLSHNCISHKSIYIDSSGRWKLGNFELLCKFEDQTSDHLEYCNSITERDYIPKFKVIRIS